MWMKRSACSLMAATTFGCEWPVVTTAMPAVKSRNRLPSTSVTQQPWPRSITKGYDRVKLGDIAFASRAMSSAALGPGSGVLSSGFTGGKHNGRNGQGEVDEIGKGVLGPPGDAGRPEADRRHLQLGGESDLRNHWLGAPLRRGGASLVGDAWQAIGLAGLDR